MLFLQCCCFLCIKLFFHGAWCSIATTKYLCLCALYVFSLLSFVRFILCVVFFLFFVTFRFLSGLFAVCSTVRSSPNCLLLLVLTLRSIDDECAWFVMMIEWICMCVKAALLLIQWIWWLLALFLLACCLLRAFFLFRCCCCASLLKETLYAHRWCTRHVLQCS